MTKQPAILVTVVVIEELVMLLLHTGEHTVTYAAMPADQARAISAVLEKAAKAIEARHQNG